MTISYMKDILNNYIKYWFTILCMFLLNNISNAQVVVKMKLDTADIVVGQQVQLSTTVTADRKQKVVFPEYDNEKKWLVEGVEVIRQSKIDTNSVNEGKRVELNCKYTITAFDSALYTIPPFEVEVDGEKFQAGSSLGLKVNFIPVDTTKVEDFAGPHGIVPEVFIWKYKSLWIALGAWFILLLMVIIGICLTNKKPLTVKRVFKPQTPPYKQASEAIRKFSSFTTTDKESEKIFYVEVTDILRVYIQRRFGVPAMEKTTCEILHAIESYVDKQALENLRLVFETADLVKFAKHMTSNFDKERCVMAVKNFLDATLDDALEHPKPEVRVIVLNDGMQRGYRVALWTSFALLSVGVFIYTFFVCHNIYEIYFN